MNQKLLIIVLLIPIIFSLMGFSKLNTTSNQPILIRIEITQAEDLSKLSDLSVSVFLRTDEYVVATIESDRLSLLRDKGFEFKIIDRQVWTQPYFLINRPQSLPLETIPPIGEIIDQSDDKAIIKALADATKDLRIAGFQITQLPDQPIPLKVTARRTVEDFRIKRLQDPIIGAIIKRVSDDFIRAGIQRLEDFQTRHSGSDSVYAASQWIYNQFKSYGYSDVKFDTLSRLVEGRPQRNVLATKQGTTYPDSIIIIGGHYDSVVYDGTNTRVYAPGADDNATGTVAALEAARILADFDLEATVIFACWAAEEQGLYGAWDFVQKASQQNLNIGAYLNFDMIGNLNEQDPVRDVTFYINSASQGLAELMQDMAFLYTTLEPRFVPASGGSDHWPFLQMGYYSVGTEEGDFSPHWHLRTDVIENVNIPYANEVIRMGLATLLHLAGPPEQISGAYVTYGSLDIDDDNSGQSIGNDNSFLDPGESIELSLSLKNAGNTIATSVTATLQTDDPYVTIIDSFKSYGDIAPGDSAISSDPFVFSISSQIPDNRSIIFSLILTDSQGHSWDSRFLLKVAQPLLVYENCTITEVVGDGDQIPDIGETCNLYIHLGNYGRRPAEGVIATLSTYDPDISIPDNQASIFQILQDSIAVASDDPFIIQIKDTALPHKVAFRLSIQEGAGYYTTSIEFSILLEQGRVLLVIDDGPANNSIGYTQILDDFGIPTDQWRVSSQGPVPQNIMLQHQTIIWFTGTEPINTLTPNDQENLKAFLDNGGNLLLSGQMLGFNIKDTQFYSNYVHAKFINLRTGLHHLRSTPENAVTTLDSISLATAGSTLQTFTSEIDPIVPALPLYTYNTGTAEGPGNIKSSGTAVLAMDNGTFKIIYCAFGFEGIIPYDARKSMLSDILGWFKGSALDTRAILSLENFQIDDDSQDDSQGDGDGFINPGETIELHLELQNIGNLTAKDVQASLRTDNSYITIMDSTTTYGDIASGSSASATDAFAFFVNNTAPHRTPIIFDLIINDSTGNRWDQTLMAIIYLSNTITGQICDIGTGSGIAGAEFYWNGPLDQIGQSIEFGEITADSSGHYSFSAPIGWYAFRAWAQGYVISDAVYMEFPPDTTLNFELTSPQIAIAPDSIAINLNIGETVTDTLTIRNSHTGQLFYSLLEMGQRPVTATANTMSTMSKTPLLNFNGIKKYASKSANLGNSTSPDPGRWKLMHVDPDEPDVELDINECFIQNDAQDIYFKITAHQPWGNPAIDFIFAIFMDTDVNFNTGLQINNIGADYLIALGNVGNLILSWTVNGWNPISGDSAPHYLQLLPNTDSLQVGIHLNQIRNPRRINLANAFLVTAGTIGDIAPDNGLFHIPYSTFDASWLNESSFYGVSNAGETNIILLTFNTDGITAGSYQTYLEIVNNQPEGETKIIPVRLNVGPSSVADGSENVIPKAYALHPNYPNPFNPETTIKYDLPQAGMVKLEVYNLIGQKLKTLVFEFKKAGYHQVHWNGKTENNQSVASGIYFYRIESGNFVAVKKMLLIQ